MSKKQGIRAVCFVLLFVIILIPLTYMLRTNGDVKDRFVGFYAEPRNSIDVIMVGSSPVYPGYSAPQLYGETGIAMYPLSTNLQRPKAILSLVEEAESRQNPELYVIELRMFTAADEDLVENMAYTRGVTDNLRYSLRRIRAINRLTTGAEPAYTFYFDIFKYHSNWKTLVFPSQWRTAFYAYKDDQKGYVLDDRIGPTELVDMSAYTQRKAIPQDAEDTLVELMEYMQAHGKKVLFVVTTYEMDESKQGMYNYMSDVIQAYSEKTGLQAAFLNMNDHYEEIGSDFGTDFYDYGGHTNAIGAQKVTQFLGQYLKQQYQLPDHRGEAGYKSWQKAYEQWQEEWARAKEVIDNRIATGDLAPRDGEE